jgi:hypothetical protein
MKAVLCNKISRERFANRRPTACKSAKKYFAKGASKITYLHKSDLLCFFHNVQPQADENKILDHKAKAPLAL